MPVLVRIALRNLKEHRSKTVIIGTIIMVGVIILVIGNSLMDTATLGIRQTFIDNFTADIMISGQATGKVSLFGVASPGGMEDTPLIPEFDRVYEFVSGLGGIEYFAPQISGAATIRAEDQPKENRHGLTFLIASDFDVYHKMLPSAKIIEGRFLYPGEEGIVITEDNKKNLERDLEVPIGIGKILILTSYTNRGIKIRKVPIVGIANFSQITDGLELISYLDIQTIRALKGLTLGTTGEVELDEEDTVLLDTVADLDSFFSSNDFSFDIGTGAESAELGFFDTGETTLETGSLSSQPETEIEYEDETDVGAWEYILIKADSTLAGNRIIKKLNNWFRSEGIAAEAGSWKKAAGPFSTTADVVRSVFNIAVILVAIVAVIIVTNTLVISVIERTAEIGTMRALGGQKEFVRRLFTTEIVTICVIFGAVGVVAALIILGIISAIGFHAVNPLLEVLFAGPVLKPVIHISSIILTFIIVVFVGIAANLYPLGLALKIQPVKAMQTE